MVKLLDISANTHKKILLLQGPVGPFFFNLAHDLRKTGAEVFKINLNGGDLFFYPWGAKNYYGTLRDWPTFLECYIKEKSIDLILLFGDCRPLHRIAHTIAGKCDVEVGVFEEGYVRPNYVTLERFGVNGNSQVLKQTREWWSQETREVPDPMPVLPAFRHAMVWAMLYNLFGTLLTPLFGNYQHHRDLHIFDGICWLRSFWKKWLYRISERGIEERLKNELGGRYFLVPLQVGNDAQIHAHSSFNNNIEFIETVIKSFAKYASQDLYLVIKQHPLERGYSHNGPLIEKLAILNGISDRVLYIHDQHLPSLLTHARGVVVINSTVGLSAMHHNCPVIAMGEAIYSMPGLTYQGVLDDFWENGCPPSRSQYHAFFRRLIHSNQINGNFYRRLPVPEFRSGLIWRDTRNA